MPADRPTEQAIVDLVRDEVRARETPVSEGLWARVEARLPAVDRRAGAPVPPRPRARMTIVHSSVRRTRRLVAVAASLLILTIGLAWRSTAREDPSERLVSRGDLRRALDRQALEGPLELDGATRPLGRDLYEGVAVKLGTAGTDAIRACDPC